MPDIFDEVADQQKPKGDIFDQVAQQKPEPGFDESHPVVAKVLDVLRSPAGRAIVPLLGPAAHIVSMAANPEPFEQAAGAGQRAGATVGEAAAEHPTLATVSPVLPLLAEAGAPEAEKQAFRAEHPIAAGVGRAAGSLAGGMVADPRNLPFLIGGPAGVAENIYLKRLAGLGFSVLLGKGATEEAGQFGSVMDNPDVPLDQKVELATGAILGTGMAGLAGGGAFDRKKATPQQLEVLDLADKARAEEGKVAPQVAEPAKVPEPIAPQAVPEKGAQVSDRLDRATNLLAEERSRPIMPQGKVVAFDAETNLPIVQRVPKQGTTVPEAGAPIAPQGVESEAVAPQKWAGDKSAQTTQQAPAGETFYHGTHNAEAIRRSGFGVKATKGEHGTSFVGDKFVDGVFVTRNRADFAEGGQLEGAQEVLPVKIEATKIKKVDGFQGIVDLYKEYGISTTEPRARQKLTAALRRDGYDGVDAGHEVAVLDPSKVKLSEPAAPQPPAEPPADIMSPPVKGAGPGARSAFTGNESGVDIAQMTRSLEAKAKGDPSLLVQAASNLGEQAAKAKEAAYAQLGEAKAQAFGKVEQVKAIGQSLWGRYTAEPKVNDFERAKGKWQGAIQKSDWELEKFSKAVQKAYPDQGRREAMAVYAEAGGDAAKLAEWAKQSKGKGAKKYELAQQLTDDEKLFARNARNYWDAKLDQAIQAGILDHGVEEYVSHLVKKQNPVTRRLMAQIAIDKLQTRPFFAKQRVHDTLFDLEQTGHSVDADLGKMMAVYDQAFSRVLASRAYIKSLLEGKASDGRPLATVSGGGNPIPKGEAPEAYLVRPKIKPDEAGDYRVVDHPALRKWKWATNDGEGKPIFVQGDILIHPEAFHDVKNNLSRSWFRIPTSGAEEVARVALSAAMRVGATIKGTMLDLSGFHQSQVSLHGMEHRVNPMRLVDINLDDPRQSKLVDWGVQIADFRAQEAFSEGSTQGSLIKKIPGLGKVAQAYSHYLFRDFIPRMKMTMALHALDRNIARYKGEFSEDQIYRLTAEQANAAFGELNYRMMGRNPTFQDILRLTLLAPDFLEARTRFVGQALKPFGREQQVALVGGAVALYAMARIINKAVDNDPHWDRPFSVVYNNKEYRLRTVQGDLEHLIRDPRQFAWVRLNPVTTKPVVEMVFGRDEWGRKRTKLEQAKDLVGQAVPIVFQKKVRNPADYNLLDSFLQAIGASSTRYRSSAERTAQELGSEHGTFSPNDEQTFRRDNVKRLIKGLREGSAKPADVQASVREGKITKRDAKNILERSRYPEQHAQLIQSFRSLPIGDALDIWDEAAPEEKKILRPYLAQKRTTIPNLLLPQQAEMRQRLHDALAAK